MILLTALASGVIVGFMLGLGLRWCLWLLRWWDSLEGEGEW